ncbi:MAG: ATP-binding protein [Planctomycetota bacterium]|jgi:SpoVK/Ycf46/Vps4 family AAA+-type ATPase|nr:ATP-binding protein [Planctomycetota bacterium]
MRPSQSRVIGDLANHMRRSIDETLSEARVHLSLDQRKEASQRYQRAARLMDRYAEYAPNRKIQHARKVQSMRFREIARNIGRRHIESHPSNAQKRKSKSARASRGKSACVTDQIHEWLTKSAVTWDDIGGLDDAKQNIQFSLMLALTALPPGVSMPTPRTILFYGPPGTGKTLLAAATSNSLVTSSGESSSFFNVRLSSVLSKYFGESSRLITELYDAARQMAPSVVFLDEFDALCRDREYGDSGPERRILASILSELDGLAGKDTNSPCVLTLAATNRPWDIDSAVLSRFEKRIEIPIPDEKTRVSILACHLDRIGVPVEVEKKKLAEMTRGFSGREIERLIKDVLARMLARENQEKIGLLKREPLLLEGKELKVSPLTMDDFVWATDRIRPETTPDIQMRYQKWSKIP